MACDADGHVGPRGRGHHGQVVLVGPGPHLGRARHHPGVGEVPPRPGGAVGVGGDDGHHLEARGGPQQGPVDDRARHAVAHQGDAHGATGAHGVTLVSSSYRLVTEQTACHSYCWINGRPTLG